MGSAKRSMLRAGNCDVQTINILQVNGQIGYDHLGYCGEPRHRETLPGFKVSLTEEAEIDYRPARHPLDDAEERPM